MTRAIVPWSGSSKRQIEQRQFPESPMAFQDLNDPALRDIPGFHEFMNQPLDVETLRQRPVPGLPSVRAVPADHNLIHADTLSRVNPRMQTRFSLLRTPRTCVLAILLAGAATQLPAQINAPPEDGYRLDFTIHETQHGQQPKEHRYSLVLNADNWGKVTAGSKVPYLTEKDKYNYADVGVSINCRLHERGSQVFFEGKFEMSSKISGGELPQIQSIRSDMSAALPLGKLTRLASLDDPSGEHRYELDVIATKL